MDELVSFFSAVKLVCNGKQLESPICEILNLSALYPYVKNLFNICPTTVEMNHLLQKTKVGIRHYVAKIKPQNNDAYSNIRM